jgi:ankyrin repeat protein
VLALLASGVRELDARDKDLATPLYWGASRGHLQICQALIKAGSDVNACVKWGSTALHAAADRGHAECLNLLLAK